MFGHIAHYDSNGFYSTWFTDIKSCRNWVEHVTGSWLSGIGDPRFTWSDVEQALVQWIKDNQIQEQLDELHQLDVERKELAVLHALQQKYAPQEAHYQIDEEFPVMVEVEIPASQTADR